MNNDMELVVQIDDLCLKSKDDQSNGFCYCWKHHYFVIT